MGGDNLNKLNNLWNKILQVVPIIWGILFTLLATVALILVIVIGIKLILMMLGVL